MSNDTKVTSCEKPKPVNGERCELSCMMRREAILALGMVLI